MGAPLPCHEPSSTGALHSDACTHPQLEQAGSWDGTEGRGTAMSSYPLVRMHHSLTAGALAQAQKEGMDTAGLTIPPCLLVVSSRKCST